MSMQTIPQAAYGIIIKPDYYDTIVDNYNKSVPEDEHVDSFLDVLNILNDEADNSHFYHFCKDSHHDDAYLIYQTIEEFDETDDAIFYDFHRPTKAFDLQALTPDDVLNAVNHFKHLLPADFDYLGNFVYAQWVTFA